MVDQKYWLLPEGVDELLPPAARQLELLRRRVLDVFHAWGFDYVEPPIIEYLESLQVGSGSDLDLQTLKVIDQRTGRLLGVRADMTSQAARIDAHSLREDGVRRLCYAGTVVHANPVSVLESRVPLKAGAEIFGSRSPAADAEVVALLVETLHGAGVNRPVLVLGHMGIYQSLLDALDLPRQQAADLFAAVQRKSETDIAELLGARPETGVLERLPTLMGRQEVFNEARQALARAPAGVAEALDALEQLAAMVWERCPQVELRFDLSELAGYGYHNGPVFSAYQADQGSAVARGGRYDGIGGAFGRSRPATGFDVNLKLLLTDAPAVAAVWVPVTAQAPGFLDEVRSLRLAGEVVVCALSAEEAPPPRCNRALEKSADGWAVHPLT
jgi:ATP phosphoribosyltransferase regulatory subunit